MPLSFGFDCIKQGDGQLDRRAVAFLAIAWIIISAPLDLSQLVFVLIGALAYAATQALALPTTHRRHPGKGKASAAPPASEYRPCEKVPCQKAPVKLRPQAPRTSVPTAAPGKELRQPSSKPVLASSFSANGWDGEVEELVTRLCPTPEGSDAMRRLARVVQQALRRTFPGAEVAAFASGEIARGTACSVAVPEVDLVISVNPSELAARLAGRGTAGGGGGGGGGGHSNFELDGRKLQKSSIRACTDILVASGLGFKFRRSAFRGQEPKVTLLAPSSACGLEHDVPFDLSVNCAMPLHNAALLMECGHLDPRARELILLVKRWAKERGVCHAAKGHLSPYCWTLMSIYFLQVGIDNQDPLLPPLEQHLKSSIARLADGGDGSKAAARAAQAQSDKQERKSTGELFKKFLRFYSSTFDWRGEAVAPRIGRRAPPDVTLPLHIVLHEDGVTSEVGPSIEDPFEGRRNLGSAATAASLRRLREELSRAEELCFRPSGGSLAELLQPWAPSEWAGGSPA